MLLKLQYKSIHIKMYSSTKSKSIYCILYYWIAIDGLYHFNVAPDNSGANVDYYIRPCSLIYKNIS